MNLSLHRVEKHADWEKVPKTERNVWQRLAVMTRGIVTIGNFFSLLGLLSVPYGLYLMSLGDLPMLKYVAFFYAIPVLALGRICDLLDGWLADKTGTKSPLGEKIDASFDKISTVAIVVGLVYLKVVGWGVLALLIFPHILIASIALLAYSHGHGLHPSRTGKNSMAVAWICLFAFVVDYAFSTFSIHGKIAGVRLLAFGLLIVSVYLGFVSVLGYIREYRQSEQKAK